MAYDPISFITGLVVGAGCISFGGYLVIKNHMKVCKNGKL